MPLPIPGEEKEFLMFDHLRVEAQWEGRHKPTKEITAHHTVDPGWIIRDLRVEINSSNHGWRKVELFEAGAQIQSKKETEEFYNEKIETAIKDGKKDIAAKYEYLKNQHLKYYYEFNTNKNVVVATLYAQPHGTAWVDTKRGWEEITVYAKCMYLGLPAEDALKQQLASTPSLSDSAPEKPAAAAASVARLVTFSDRRKQHLLATSSRSEQVEVDAAVATASTGRETLAAKHSLTR